MKKWMIVLIAVGVLALIGLGFAQWGVGKYNNLISLGQGVDKSWGQVENVLQRRNDLIPNLVNVVQAYAIHEQEVFIKVAEARNLWTKAVQGGTVSDKIKADSAVSGALLNLMAVSERYPELKANENFLALQDELAGTENRITVERMRFNESVQTYNTFAKMFPNNVVVGMFKFPAERDYFKAVEGATTVPQVRINYPGVPVPGVPQNTLPVAPAPVPAPVAPTAPTVPTMPTAVAPAAPVVAPVPVAPATPTAAPQAMPAPAVEIPPVAAPATSTPTK